MKKHRNITLKRAAAMLFVLLGGFVHLGKVVHHHDYAGSHHGCSEEANGGPAKIVAEKSCAICDYHFVKDSDGQAFYDVPIRPAAVIQNPAAPTREKSWCIKQPASLRGPPTTA